MREPSATETETEGWRRAEDGSADQQQQGHGDGDGWNGGAIGQPWAGGGSVRGPGTRKRCRDVEHARRGRTSIGIVAVVEEGDELAMAVGRDWER